MFIEAIISTLVDSRDLEATRAGVEERGLSADLEARAWARMGHPIITARYLRLSSSLSEPDKTKILAMAFDNYGRKFAEAAADYNSRGGFINTEDRYSKLAVEAFSKARELRQSLEIRH